MVAKIKSIFSSDLLKVFSFTGLSTLIKLITSYVSVKVVAAIVGPSGIALIGQLQNFINIMITLGAGGINNGVVKYVSENKADRTVLGKFLQNGIRLTVVFSLFFGFLLLVLSKFLSQWILLSSSYAYVFIFFGITLLLLSLNNFFISVLNGFKEFKTFVYINIITSVLSLIFTVALVFFFHLKGALIAAVTAQSIILFVTVFFLRKFVWFDRDYLLGKFDRNIVRKYLSYSAMALITAATAPVSQLVVRGYIIKNYSITEAGYWEAMNRISALLLLFVTTSFSVYYLPKFSETHDKDLLRIEIKKAYKIITPVLLLMLSGIFVLKIFIIRLLFTKEFFPMENLFFWQLLGDFFKILSWILAFLMVAKSMTRLFIITEIVFSALFVGLAVLLIMKHGIIGATQAYFINYLLYFIIMLVVFRKLLFKFKP